MKGQMDDSIALPINAEVRDATASGTELLGRLRRMTGIAVCTDAVEYIEQLQRIERVCYDLHDALGVEWGHDPYSVIREGRAQRYDLAEALRALNLATEHFSVHLISQGVLITEELAAASNEATDVLKKLDTGTAAKTEAQTK